LKRGEKLREGGTREMGVIEIDTLSRNKEMNIFLQRIESCISSA
jgi:hypothetical protein